MIVELKRRSFVQKLGFDEFEQRVRDGEVPPDTLVRFEPVTGQEFQPAGELEFYREAADPDRLAFRRNLTQAGIPLMTAIVVGLQVRVHWWSLVQDRRMWLQEHFANWGPAVFERGEVWRIFTYSLLHADLSHILMNTCFLGYSGYHLERALGRRNLALVYLSSVFGGGLLSLLMSPKRYSLGASGGVFGLIGATIILGWKYWDEIPERSRKYFGWALMPYVLWSALSGLRNAEHVDNWCHLGGLIGGVVMATVLEPEVLHLRRRANRLWSWAAAGGMAAALAALTGAGTRLIPLAPEDTGAWLVQRPSYWQQGWTLTGDRGWFSPTLQANIAATRTTHPAPPSLEEAAAALVTRISSGSRDSVTVESQPLSVDGIAGERLTLRFRRSESERAVDAVVLVRGRTEYRVVLQTDSDTESRYAPLMERILASMVIGEDEAVTRARQRVQDHPRSWEPAVDLGVALRDAGAPVEAMEWIRTSLEMSPGEPAVLEAMLRTCQDYPTELAEACATVVDDAMTAAGDHPRVVVAVVMFLEQRGDTDRARAVLDAAWELMPGDRTLRRARHRLGLGAEPVPEAVLEPQDQE